MFSKLHLNDLINLLTSIPITYRDSLNFSKLPTFGLELEYQKDDNKNIDIAINNYPDWSLVSEDTLANGHEIVSPILKNELETWKNLQDICYILKENQVNISNAGGHIHVGSSILGKEVETWKNFLKLYTIYEDILFYFSYNETKMPRKSLAFYAKPVAKDFNYRMKYINKVKSLEDVCYTLPYKEKFNAINFSHTMFLDILNTKDKNTIEFRFPAASKSELIWQNNINTFINMLLKSSTLDSNFLDYLLKQCDFSNLQNYQELNLVKALEFADLVFDNDLDKLYFLKQYLNGFSDKEYILKK